MSQSLSTRKSTHFGMCAKAPISVEERKCRKIGLRSKPNQLLKRSRNIFLLVFALMLPQTQCLSLIGEGTSGILPLNHLERFSQWKPLSRMTGREFSWMHQSKIDGQHSPSIYFEIFNVLIQKQPHRMRDIMICFLKAFTYSRSPVTHSVEHFLLNIVLNAKASYRNLPEDLEPLPECLVTPEFAEDFEQKYPSVGLSEVLDNQTLYLISS